MVKNKIIQTIRYYKPEIVENAKSDESLFYLTAHRNLKFELVRSYRDSYGYMLYDLISNRYSHNEIKEIEWESDIDVPLNSKIKIGEKEYLVNDKVYNMDNTITYYVEDAVEKCENYDELFDVLSNELKLNKKKSYKNLYTIIDRYKKNEWFIENYIYKIKNNETGYEYEIKNHEWYKYEKEYYWDGEMVWIKKN